MFGKIFTLLAATVIAGCCASAPAQSPAECRGKELFTRPACAGDDVSAAEQQLASLVNQYRTETRRSSVPVSNALSIVANRHLIDITENLRALTHSWSNCRYDIADQATWNCILESPTRVNVKYDGQTYETLYVKVNGTASPAEALAAWKKSVLHNSIIENLDTFKDLVWKDVGVAIRGRYAALMFGAARANASFRTGGSEGLGLTFEKVTAGLAQPLGIKLSGRTSSDEIWSGSSPDKKIAFEMSGKRSRIAEAHLTVKANVARNGAVSPAQLSAFRQLLKNVVGGWADRDAWLTESLRAVGADRTAVRAKLVEHIAIEVSADADGNLVMQVTPTAKKRALEF